MTGERAWAVVAVDLDGTLITETTACLHLGDWIGHRSVIEELERRFVLGEIDSAAVADGDAPYYAGRTVDDVTLAMASVPCLSDIDEGVRCLNRKGISALICTVSWTFAAQCLADRFGFVAVSGTVMGVDADGRLSGRVERYFEPEDKVAFVRDHCTANGFGLDQVVAIGDGRSDVPLFRAAGFSVALNASQDARAASSVAVESRSFMEALRVVPGLLRP
ncbi:MAG TPA: HAD-IB family phosphatase [Acidimicrobiales bacterium]|jgi:phosphoserine phosphatase